MKYKWLHSANTKDSLVKDLIIFMGGFGSDPCHFHHLKIYDCDVVMFYDYRDLNTLNSYNTHDIFKNLSYYRHIYLIAFSLGVCVANAMFSSIWEQFTHTLAINGTPLGVDKIYGIPPVLFRRTMKHLDSQQFRTGLLGHRLDAHFTLRDNQALRDELGALYEFSQSIHSHQCQRWEYALISRNDEIFPPEANKQYWLSQSPQNTQILWSNEPHFVFFNFTSWEELCHLQKY